MYFLPKKFLPKKNLPQMLPKIPPKQFSQKNPPEKVPPKKSSQKISLNKFLPKNYQKLPGEIPQKFHTILKISNSLHRT